MRKAISPRCVGFPMRFAQSTVYPSSARRNRSRSSAPTRSGWPNKTDRHMENACSAGLGRRRCVALTWKQFLRILERQGYAFRFDRKHPTLILPGSGRTVRFKTLGMRYTPETLQRRILYPKPAHRLGKNRRRSAGAFSFPEKSPTAGALACGRSTFPIYTRWAHCRKSHGT